METIDWGLTDGNGDTRFLETDEMIGILRCTLSQTYVLLARKGRRADGKTYRFPHFDGAGTVQPFYAHELLSWRNVASDKPWPVDEDYLMGAVAAGRRLVSPFRRSYPKELGRAEVEARFAEEAGERIVEGMGVYADPAHVDGDERVWDVYLIKDGCLADWFDSEELADRFSELGADLDWDFLDYLFGLRICDLFAGDKVDEYGTKLRWHADIASDCGFVCHALAMGHPIESMVGSLND